ncbi:adenosylcobinamide-GDP ribazoletransferase [Stutzerimonas stutzeri]|uniref:adenosylcobinamide-GDP ribazoletransferase n=1 Tax=Stutzerimonas stutzeri TaxID=316 RepID=UPI003C6EBBF4
MADQCFITLGGIAVGAILWLGSLTIESAAVPLQALAVSVGIGWLARRAICRRIGGTTGDTAGALLELVECGVLVALALRV